MSQKPVEVAQRELEAQPKQPVARELTRTGAVFRPDVDIVELPEEYRVYADMPGSDGEHVQIRLEEGMLSIDGALALEPEPGWVPLRREYRLGGWHREFQLSERIAADRISAQMRDGVLEIHLPKAEAHRPRRIEVRTA